MKKKTQTERVLAFLKKHKYITALDGFTKMSPPITQIHTVVHRLRVQGHVIDSEIFENKKTGTKFSRWKLVK